MSKLHFFTEGSVSNISLQSDEHTLTTTGPYGVHDTLRNGIHSVAHDLAPRHPLATSLSTAGEDEERRRIELGKRLLGSHIPERLRMEKAIVMGGGRMNGLPSANLALSILDGTDEILDVCNVLNVPSMSPYNS